MYHPYLRGKQYELITVREMAPLMAECRFEPIIEPVKETLSGLARTIKVVDEAKGKLVVIVNPEYGVYAEDGTEIADLVQSFLVDSAGLKVGMLLKERTTREQIEDFLRTYPLERVVLVHSGFTDARGLSEWLGERIADIKHVFYEPFCGKVYTRHFKGGQRVLIRDGFQKRRNADHPPVEMFSDLHVTYPDENMNGFGDFLIVGDDYSETGGPAYAVAIHLTYIDRDKEDVMYVRHFVSRRKDTPADPGGKFREALESMMKELNRPECKILASKAVEEFRELYERRHFPGLGYVKKLSMNHHIETLANYLS